MTRRKLLGFAASFLVVLALLRVLWFAPPEQKDFGRYRVVRVEGLVRSVPIVSPLRGTSDLFCRPRQELYFERIHLATCETPSGFWIGPQPPIPDPFCFTIARDGSSASYWTRRTIAAPEPARTKAAGVYFHSTAKSERLLYETGSEVHPLWGGDPAAGGIIIGLGHPKGFRVVGPDGVERLEIKPTESTTDGR